MNSSKELAPQGKKMSAEGGIYWVALYLFYLMDHGITLIKGGASISQHLMLGRGLDLLIVAAAGAGLVTYRSARMRLGIGAFMGATFLRFAVIRVLNREFVFLAVMAVLMVVPLTVLARHKEPQEDRSSAV